MAFEEGAFQEDAFQVEEYSPPFWTPVLRPYEATPGGDGAYTDPDTRGAYTETGTDGAYTEPYAAQDGLMTDGVSDGFDARPHTDGFFYPDVAWTPIVNRPHTLWTLLPQAGAGDTIPGAYTEYSYDGASTEETQDGALTSIDLSSIWTLIPIPA